MFEAIIALCLPDAPEQCRNMLLPGYEAARNEDCRKRVLASPMDWNTLFATAKSLPLCVASGAALPFAEIADGIFVHRGRIADADADNHGDIANIGFIIGEESIAVIDAAGSRLIAEQAYRAIRRVSSLPISHLLLTHIHPDHIFGASVFSDAGAIVVAHADFVDELARRRFVYARNFRSRIGARAFIGSAPPDPDIDLTGGKIRIELGGRSLIVTAWPPAHTHTDLTVLDESGGVLFAGDLLFVGHIPVVDGSINGWISVMEKMSDIPASIIVPGHGGPSLPRPQAEAEQLRYLTRLKEDATSAVKQGLSLREAMETIATDERSKWELFELFHARNVTRVYTELEWE